MTSDDVTFPHAVYNLLDRPVTATICTINPDGSPHPTVVWFERRGEELVLFALEDSIKVRNLRRDPRVDVVVIDFEHPRAPGVPPYVRLIGTADVRPGEAGFPDKLAIRYGHPNGYPWPLGRHAAIHITPGRMTGMGPYRGGSRNEWAPIDSDSRVPAPAGRDRRRSS